MTVNITLMVCEVLQENGYGDYEMTSECGFVTLSEYVNAVRSGMGIINMEGNYERDNDLLINQLIHDALERSGYEG